MEFGLRKNSINGKGGGMGVKILRRREGGGSTKSLGRGEGQRESTDVPRVPVQPE